LIKLLLALCLSLIFVGCTRDKDEVDLGIFSGPEVQAEIFSNSPANDQNPHDRYEARKILPDHKLNKTYKYKYYIKGYFDYKAFLKNHREDAVTTSGSSPEVFTARIYSDNRIVTSDL